MNYNSKKHHRRSIRLKGYDYSRAGLYFITICTHNRMNLFGKIQDGKMILNHFGNIIKEEWEKTTSIRKDISLGEYCIMPNHFHGIIEILETNAINIKELGNLTFTATFKAPSKNIGAIIRGFKGASTLKIKNSIRSTACKGSIESIGSKGELQFAPTAPTAPTSQTAPKTQTFFKKSIWQRNYYEHIIKDEKAFQNISKYIMNNPKKWKEDTFYKDK